MSRTWIIVALAVGMLAAAGIYSGARSASVPPIRIGILHTLDETTTMALSERPIVDAYLLAIDEINAHGGVLGRRIEPVIRDGKSEPQVFHREAVALIDDEHVCTIFGCWTSAAQRTVRAVVKERNHLLIYPVEAEGLIETDNVVYTGAVPNQQVIPAVTWLYNQGKRKFFLIGSDYIFPRCANAVAKDQMQALGAHVAGERYIRLGGDQTALIDEIVAEIKRLQPDAILNTINGDKNQVFFRALRRAGITPDKIPTMSTSIAEHELQSMNAREMAGDFATWNYFESVNTPRNNAFVGAFRERYGSDRVTDDPIEAGYFGVYLWKQAVEEAGSDAAPDILKAMRRQSMNAPEGVVYVDPENLHTWKTVRVGRILPNGQFKIEWSSEKPIRPVPYPVYRRREEWDAFRDQLFKRWGQRWANEGEP